MAPSDPAAGTVWRLAGGGAARAREWGDCAAVYNASSGDTHILDLVSAELLAAIGGDGAAAQQLYARIGAFLELPVDAALAVRVDSLLAHLDAIGLIEPADPCA